MTKHVPPRVKNGALGNCTYPMERVALPQSFRISYAYTSTTPEQLETAKAHIVRDRPFDHCRVWEKR